MAQDVTGGSGGSTKRSAPTPAQQWAQQVFSPNNPGLPWNVFKGQPSPAPTSVRQPAPNVPNLYGPTPSGTGYVQGGRPANVYSNTPANTAQTQTQGDPRGTPPPGFTSWAQYDAYVSSLNGSASSAASSAASDLAEKRREFDLTYQRDVAKQNATEVDSLQKMLAGLSGPKDVYADLFFSHGLLPPRGYKPAPVPLTQAQTDAYTSMGVNPQQLQEMISGNGQPGADTGMLGSLGQSLQPQPGQPGFQQVQPDQVQQSGPSNPTAQGGALYGKAPVGATPQVPAMAGGGEVPGQVGDPRLVVAHGGEEVNNNTDQGQLVPNSGGVHPAIQKLMDALSELLASPDFQQYAGSAGKAAAIAKPAKKGKAAPAPPVTPGGIQAMATGGTVSPVTDPASSASGASLSSAQTLQYQQSGRNPLLNPSPPTTPSPVPKSAAPVTSGLSGATSTAPVRPTTGIPTAGAQGVSVAPTSTPKDNPIMPIEKMDPYTRALYDVHGRLHPYSAQQQMQMGPQGVDAVNSYIGRVLGGDVKGYTDLLDRLKPIGAPEASGASAGGGFKFG